MKQLMLAVGGRSRNNKPTRRKLRTLPNGSSPTCPHCCKRCKSTVRDSRQSGDSIRRRRTCLNCGHRYTSYETTATDNMDTVREWISATLLPHIEELFKNNNKV